MKLGVVSSALAGCGFEAGRRLQPALLPAAEGRDLREVGYDGAISIEHEDLHMSPQDGLTNAVGFLAPLLRSA
jgi:hypothetical protein